ncbi:MAG TPA: hypothetical protein VI895_04340 [Bdellovibrionota bacterium]|nr:hypothetical protein [Bdellovibrionota bacterium]
MYEKVLEPVIQRFTGERYLPELKVAREDYFRKSGKVHEEEPTFEMRMTSFLEWYMCDRPLWDSGVPPVRLYSEMFGETLSEEDRTILHGLERSIRSLFLMLNRKGERFRVKDLYDQTEYDVLERRTHVGINRNDIFETRILRVGNQAVFSDAMIVHPLEAHKYILGEATKQRASSRETFGKFLFDLAAKRLKCDRFKHVPASQIYSTEIPDA